MIARHAAAKRKMRLGLVHVRDAFFALQRPETLNRPCIRENNDAATNLFLSYYLSKKTTTKHEEAFL
jgi:hypothetical protein